MEGYKFELEDELGNPIPYWLDSTSVLYKEESDGESTRDVTVTVALDELYEEIAGITNTLGNVTTSIATLTNAIAQMNPGGSTSFSVDIDSETGCWIINDVLTSYPSRGEIPVLSVGEDGYWYVDGVKQDACPAQGPQGLPGTPGSTIYVTGEGGGGGIAGRGTFGQALDYIESQENGEYMLFGWILDDEDENHVSILKVIYHIGNGTFIDALGATVIGSADGITGS